MGSAFFTNRRGRGGESLKKFYAVAYGGKIGIFTTLEDYQAAIKGAHGLRAKGFNNREAAEAFLRKYRGIPYRPADAPPRYYAVRKGRIVGIFTSTKAYEKSVKSYPGADGRRFKTLEEAQAYLTKGLDATTAALYISLGPNPTYGAWHDLQNGLPGKVAKRHIVTPETMEQLERLLKKEYVFTLSLPEDLILYADASYEEADGIGYAGLASSVYRADGTRVFELTSAVSDVGMTSQQAEALAVISPLLHIDDCRSLQIYSDCQALSAMVQAQRPSTPLETLLCHLIEMQGAKLSWVKGHADNDSNNRVDRLAKLARRHLIETKHAAVCRREAMKKPRTVRARLVRILRFLRKLFFR